VQSTREVLVGGGGGEPRGKEGCRVNFEERETNTILTTTSNATAVGCDLPRKTREKN